MCCFSAAHRLPASALRLLQASPLMVAAMVLPEPSIPLMRFLIEELGADPATTHGEDGSLMDVLVGDKHAHLEVRTARARAREGGRAEHARGGASRA